jgi:hypothetical protein
MATLLNNDNLIWLKHIKADANVLALLNQVPAGTKLKFEVAGVVGDWERMKDGKDGRRTPGSSPLVKL